MHKLSADEIEDLTRLHRETNDDTIRSRCDMILLHNDGLSPSHIGEQVPFSRYTVARYVDRYEASGLAGLATKHRSGRPRRVTSDYEARLMATVRVEPHTLGLPFSHWTTANLAVYLAQQTGIAISARQVENYLKAHGWHRPRSRREAQHRIVADRREGG
jgi:transposase